MRFDYRTEIFQKASICGIPCDFSDMRIDRSTVPEGRYQHEVAGDDDSSGDPARVQRRVLVNSLGTLISDVPMFFGGNGILWLNDGDFVYL